MVVKVTRTDFLSLHNSHYDFRMTVIRVSKETRFFPGSSISSIHDSRSSREEYLWLQIMDGKEENATQGCTRERREWMERPKMPEGNESNFDEFQGSTETRIHACWWTDDDDEEEEMKWKGNVRGKKRLDADQRDVNEQLDWEISNWKLDEEDRMSETKHDDGWWWLRGVELNHKFWTFGSLEEVLLSRDEDPPRGLHSHTLTRGKSKADGPCFGSFAGQQQEEGEQDLDY